MQETTCELKKMRHSRIFRMKSRLFGIQMKNSFECLIHGSEFVCFLESAHLLLSLREMFESHEELCIYRTGETFLSHFLVTVTRGFGLLPTSKYPAAREKRKKNL